MLLPSMLAITDMEIAKIVAIFKFEVLVNIIAFFITVITSDLIEVWILSTTTLAVLFFYWGCMCL